jgi:hypothetical protein
MQLFSCTKQRRENAISFSTRRYAVFMPDSASGSVSEAGRSPVRASGLYAGAVGDRDYRYSTERLPKRVAPRAIAALKSYWRKTFC